MTEDHPAVSPVPPPRRKGALPRLVVLAAFAGLAVTAAGFLYYASRPTNGVRADDLRAAIESELPPGSTSEQIEAWFRQHGIADYSEMVDIGQQKNGYRAVIPNDTLFDRATVEITVRTDKAGRLESASVDRLPRHEDR